MSDTPTESGWAKLREAQRRVADKRQDAALVVTLGAGDPYDIHPPNKQEVAHRAANVGQYLIYNDPLAKRVREPLRALREGSKVVLTLSNSEQGLQTWSSDTAIGFELCNQTQCVFSSGKINNNNVDITIPNSFQPEKLRYNWADVPYGNVSDKSGMPLGTFEISID